MECEERVERAQRFAKVWWLSRMQGKKSQEYMAMGLGVSKKTIQNWEKGTSSPDFFQGTEWFRLLGLNPMPYYLSFLYPDLFGESGLPDDPEKVEEAIIQYIKQCTMDEKQQLLFIMAGTHGSSWHSLLQMVTAHCHTSMQSRVSAARIIYENYEMDEMAGKLVCPASVRPDTHLLERAIHQGKQAVINNDSGYSALIGD